VIVKTLVRAGVVAGLLALAGAGLFLAGPATRAQDVTAQPEQTFGDWIYQCTPLADGKAACALNQTLIDQASGQSVLKFSIGRDAASGKMTLVALLPLGLDFATGVSGAVDDNDAFQYGLRTCIGTTCIAIFEIDANRLEELRAGTLLKIGFRMLAEAEPRVLAGSLNGISAGTKAAGF